jgi:hypothetical protein
MSITKIMNEWGFIEQETRVWLGGSGKDISF